MQAHSPVQPAAQPTALPVALLPELLLLLLLATLWGASYTCIRVGVATIPPITLIAARTLIAGSLLALWMLVRGVPMPRSAQVWKRCAVQALLNSVLPFTLIAWAEQFVQAGVATILNSVTPVFAFLASWLLVRQEAATWRKLLGVCMGLLGIALVVGPSAWSGVGDQLVPQLAIVLASACYAAAALYGRNFKGLPPVVPAMGSMLLGAVVLVPLSLLVDRPWALQPSAQSLWALLVLAVFCTALAFAIYFRLVNTLGAVGTTAQAYLRVPIGVGLGVLFLGEQLQTTAWAGLVCVVLGVAAMVMPARGAKK